MLLETPHVKIACNRPLGIDIEFAVKGDCAYGVDRRLRRGKDGAVAKLFKQLDGCWTDHPERIVGTRGGEMNFVAGRAVTEIAVEAVQGRGRKITPAAIMCRVGRDIKTVVVNLLAIFELSADPAEGAAHNLRLQALPKKAVLHLQTHGAPQRIETEDGIVRKYVGSVNRLRGNEIPIDRVSKSLVHADAVLINGEALWRALERRSDEAAITQVL